MKNTIVIISIVFALLSGIHSKAQEKESNVKYIFKSSTELKGFGTFEMKLSQIVNMQGTQSEGEVPILLLGATGGVTVNKFLLFGVGGYGISTKASIQGTNPNKPLRLYGGYGGVLLGFNIFPRKVIHLSFPVLIGAGNIYLEDESFFSNGYDESFVVEKSTFFVAEPGALIEVNITNFFHLGIGVSYRYIDGLNMENLSSEDLTNWSGNLVFKFGHF
jgi:hypothetical protein